MHAIAVKEYGAQPVLVDLPRPEARAHHVVIEVRAAGTNPMDLKIARGAWQARMPGTFPLVLGSDFEGVVVGVGSGVAKFSPGDELFGQLVIPPLGSAGTYAEYVSAPDDAPLARVPDGLDPETAAALPTAGATALELVESLPPLRGQTILIVGAAGGVGSFATQFAANAGAHVIATARADAADRMRGYGAVETVDYTAVSLPGAVRQAHPDGIDVLVDVVSDAVRLADLASLVRPGGTAVSTISAADTEVLGADGVTGVNFQVSVSPDVLARLANDVVTGCIVSPPITRIPLDEVPTAMNGERARHADGKTVITF